VEFAAVEIAVLIAVALIAGAINTVAGGGSNLVLPTLMIMGMPPEIANATNRVGIFVESVVAVSEFKRHDRLESFDLRAILIPMAIGGLFGSLAAAFAPPDLLKPLLIGTMIFMSLLVLLRPAVVSPPSGTAVRRVKDTPSAWIGLLAAGFYGGFVQAGVGFLLLASIAGTLRYDIVRANAIKLVCTLVFTTVSLVIFVWQDQVAWLAGGILSIGYVIGAYLGVKLAVHTDPKILRWFLFAATVMAGGAALFF
jgi:uncharacterized protein